MYAIDQSRCKLSFFILFLSLFGSVCLFKQMNVQIDKSAIARAFQWIVRGVSVGRVCTQLYADELKQIAVSLKPEDAIAWFRIRIIAKKSCFQSVRRCRQRRSLIVSIISSIHTSTFAM